MIAPDGTFTKGSTVEGNYKYYIVVGAYRTNQYAQGMIDNCKNKGYNNASIIGKRQGLNVVAIDSFDSWSEARKQLDQIRTEIYPSAWILNTGRHNFD